MKFKRFLAIGILASAIAACSTDNQPVRPPVQEVITVNVTSYYNSVWFDNGSAAISQDFDVILNLNANYLKANPIAQVQIQGNASEIGTKEINQKLSVARARAVAAKLTALGVNPAQIQEVSFGAGKPTFSNGQGHSPKNRRADIIYISGAPMPYYIERLPVVSTEDESVEFDPISVKEQTQKYKPVTHNASAPADIPAAPPMITPAPNATEAGTNTPTTMDALPSDQGM